MLPGSVMSSSVLDFANDDRAAARGSRRLDFTRPFLPESLARTARLEFLTPVERLTLNHIRANSYVSVLAFMEDLCAPGSTLASTAESAGPSWFRAQFERGFRSPCDVLGPASGSEKKSAGWGPADSRASRRDGLEQESATTVQVSAKARGLEGALSPRDSVLAPLHLLWLAEIHDREARIEADRICPAFRELIRDRASRSLHEGARFDDRLDDLAARGTPLLAAQVVDAYLAYVELVAARLDRQVRHDLESLERATSRSLSPLERETLLERQGAATRWTFLGSALVHPAFLRTVGRLGASARARVEEMAWAR